MSRNAMSVAQGPSTGSTEFGKNKAHGNADTQHGELFTRHKLGNFVQQCSGSGNTHRATDQQQSHPSKSKPRHLRTTSR